MIISIITSAIFLILGLIHFNWVIGGQFGLAQSIPAKENGEKVMNPKKVDSALVGLGLMAFAAFYLLKSGLLAYSLPDSIEKYGSWVIPIIFFLRAIGEFRYVGFFKSVKGTEFAKWDTQLFSPLCLILALFGLIIKLFL